MCLCEAGGGRDGRGGGLHRVWGVGHPADDKGVHVLRVLREPNVGDLEVLALPAPRTLRSGHAGPAHTQGWQQHSSSYKTPRHSMLMRDSGGWVGGGHRLRDGVHPGHVVDRDAPGGGHTLRSPGHAKSGHTSSFKHNPPPGILMQAFGGAHQHLPLHQHRDIVHPRRPATHTHSVGFPPNCLDKGLPVRPWRLRGLYATLRGPYQDKSLPWNRGGAWCVSQSMSLSTKEMTNPCLIHLRAISSVPRVPQQCAPPRAHPVCTVLRCWRLRSHSRTVQSWPAE